MGGYNPIDQLFGSGTTAEKLQSSGIDLGVMEAGRQGLFTKQYEGAGGATGQQGFDVLSQYAESDDPLLNLGGYMQSEFGIGEEYQKYMTPFQQERFGFMERGLGLEQQGLQQALTSEEAKLGLGMGRGTREAAGQRDVAAAQAGMAGVGGITQGYQQQKEDLLKDYSLGMGQARDTYGLGMETAQLGYETDVYGEKERQTERFYDDITSIMQMKQGEGGGGKK